MEYKFSSRLSAWLKLVTPEGSSWLKSSQLKVGQRNQLVKKLIVLDSEAISRVKDFEIRVEYEVHPLYLNLHAGKHVEFIPSYRGVTGITYDIVMSCVPECSSAPVVRVKLPFPLKFGEVEMAWDETFQAEYEVQEVDFDV